MGRRRPKPLDRKIEQLAANIKQPENDLEDSINKGQKTMLSTGIFIFALFTYSLMTYFFKLTLYNYSKFKKPKHLAWKKGLELALILSPDLWWAFRFKNHIADPDPETKKANRKKFVQRNNAFNLYFSFGFGLLILIIASSSPASYWGQLLLCFAMIRFISRGYEITYAFVKDAFQKTESTTNLNSKDRIKLAMNSYIEIYFFSAPAYLILTKGFDPWAAISLSLNVGTLTNVGLAFSDASKGLETNIVFIQVFTTLSLVIFSFAMYLARPETTPT